MTVWKEITRKEFTDLHLKLVNAHGSNGKSYSEFCDFLELEWETKDGKPVLRKTEQDMYDEVEVYPALVRYFKAEGIENEI